MRRLLLASLLVLLVAGCDNTTTTTGGQTGPGGSGGGGGGGGGGGNPGPMPSTIGGMAGFSRTRQQSVGDSIGVNDFDGLVWFYPVAVPLPPTMADGWNDFPNWPMDTCAAAPESSVGESGNIAPPSAGTLTLTGPNGNVAMTLNPLQNMGIYLSAGNPGSGYVPNSQYTLAATGADIGAFSVTLDSPGDLLTLSPDPTATSPFVIPRSQPLTLTWTSVSDGRPIYLYLLQQDTPDEAQTQWMCKVQDDGSFTIPTDVLAAFDATVTPFPGETWRDKLQLRRWRLGSFTAPNAAGPILTSFESGWYADVQFQ